MSLEIRTIVRPGDLGALIHLHGSLYSEEYGFDIAFESYVGEHMSRFVRERTERERFWIADEEGEVLGCIAVVRHDEGTAQLRWYLLHPRIRGQGIGRRLLEDALAFAREKGYSRVFLYTERELTRAADIYLKAGFALTEEGPEPMWGSGFIRQRYDLQLTSR